MILGLWQDSGDVMRWRHFRYLDRASVKPAPVALDAGDDMIMRGADAP